MPEQIYPAMKDVSLLKPSLWKRFKCWLTRHDFQVGIDISEDRTYTVGFCSKCGIVTVWLPDAQ